MQTTKVRLRATSKDKKLLNESLNKCSFASKIIGLSDCKNNNSLSRERSQTELNFGINNKPDSISIEQYKIKINVLQSTIDKVIQENAVLRLKRKNLSFKPEILVEEIENQELDQNKLIHNNKLASSIARRELKILKIYQE